MYKLPIKTFYEKTMKIVSNRVKLEFNKNDENDNIFKQQPKLTFNGIHKVSTSYGSFIFKQNQVLMDKPTHLGFSA